MSLMRIISPLVRIFVRLWINAALHVDLRVF